ncbi:Peroxin-3 [Obelidium mucronatum]|nr:Peroxin-3 [Obelidium mucronatum]
MSSVSTESHDLDTESERKFLTFSWYLLHKGLFECMARVRQSVEQVFAGIAVSDDLTCDELLAHIASIRSNVEEWSIDGSSLTFSFDTYLLPPIGQEIQVLMEANRPNGVTPDASLFSCLNETRDFLESPDFSPVFRKCLDTSFGIFETQIRTVFPSQNSTLSNSKISEIPEGGPSKVKLAVSLPTVSRFTNEVLEPSENGLLQILDTVPEVKAISALIYTEWSSVAGV